MPLKIAILGAGPAGLSAALALARDGRLVTLIERDPLVPTAAEAAPAWERKGIAHFLQPHAFIPGGRRAMIDHFEDVYHSLIREGARVLADARRRGSARVACA